MKYRYFYQTKENENKEGWIKARSRENAYALLRKAGIRPYRLVGDDPLNWKPYAAGAAIVLLATALAATIRHHDVLGALAEPPGDGSAHISATDHAIPHILPTFVPGIPPVLTIIP